MKKKILHVLLGLFLLFIVLPVLLVVARCTVFFYAEVLLRRPDHVQGVVVDQENRPLAGARLNFEEAEYVWIIPLTMVALPKSWKTNIETDANGRYDLSFRYEMLDLKSIELEGYAFDSGGNWRRNFDSQLDEKQVGNFLMYAVADPSAASVKVASLQEFKIEGDGEEYHLDLMGGSFSSTQSDGGDLIFSVKQVGEKACLMTIRAVKGGIVLASNAMPYAPKEGYVPGFSVEVNGWCNQIFYARSQDGRHHSQILVEYDNCRGYYKKEKIIKFHYVLNPTGSRFLFKPEYRQDSYRFRSPLDGISDHGDSSGHLSWDDKEPWWRDVGSSRYPILPEQILADLLEAPGSDWDKVQAMQFVAKQIYTPVSILEKLSRDGQAPYSVARNPACPADILVRLAENPDEDIRKAARENLDRNLQLAEYLKSQGYFRNVR